MDRHTLRLAALFLVLAACGGGSSGVTTPPPPPGTPPPPPPPAAPPVIALVSGDGQVSIAGSALSRPLTVLVTQAGVPVAQQAVVWQTASGSLSPVQGNTAADGTASSLWLLGATPGEQSANAFVGSTSGASLLFKAVAAVVANGAQVQVDMFTAGGSRNEPMAVIVQSGTTVTWVWRDGTHSVISTGTPGFANGASADAPHSYAFTFNTPGTYRYYCFEHGAPGTGMWGMVIVQ